MLQQISGTLGGTELGVCKLQVFVVQGVIETPANSRILGKPLGEAQPGILAVQQGLTVSCSCESANEDPEPNPKQKCFAARSLKLVLTLVLAYLCSQTPPPPHAVPALKGLDSGLPVSFSSVRCIFDVWRCKILNTKTCSNLKA